jgi:hypothetical protein
MTPHSSPLQVGIVLALIAVIVPAVCALVRHELRMNRKELPR